MLKHVEKFPPFSDDFSHSSYNLEAFKSGYDCGKWQTEG